MRESVGIKGRIHAVWRDADGNIYHESVQDNLVTQVGEQMYGERGVGITTTPVPTGMKLGTGSTAPAKTGAGAALVTYLSNSHQTFDTSPASSLSSGKRRITYTATWAAGKATTASNITEVVIVNETLADSTSLAAATVSRGLLTTPAPKGAGDTLTITWTHDIGS